MSNQALGWIPTEEIGPSSTGQCNHSSYWSQKLITGRQVLATWIVAVIDDDGDFIARSGSPLDMIGRSAHSLFSQKARQAAEGQLRYTPPGGVEVYEAFTRSPLSGWTVSVTAPVEEIEASAKRAVITVFLGLLVALMVAVGAAALFEWRLVESFVPVPRALPGR